jgi:MFS family permease
MLILSSKLLAYGILHMRGVAGRPGWFWLFFLMGIFTIGGGFVLGFLLPDSFKRPTSTFLPKYRWFTDRELHILQTRVLMDDPMKGKKKASLGRDAFKRAFSYWRLYIHLFISLCEYCYYLGFLAKGYQWLIDRQQWSSARL